MRLSDFKALSFDCYGTLIDWEAGLERALAPLAEASGRDPGALVDMFGSLEHEVESEQPELRYSDLLAEVHRRLSGQLDVEGNEEAALAFGQSVGDWPAFADVPDALRYLKEHFKLIILSNVDRSSFGRSNARLGVDFDGVFTAEEIGSYKPDPRNFNYLLARTAEMGIAKAELLHVAQSLFHDHVPANASGIASAWIDRGHDKPGPGATPLPDPMPRFDFRFTFLGELAAAHRAERG